MSYEIVYNGPDAEAKALKDCKRWLGNAQFKRVSKLLQDDHGQTSRNMVRLGMAMQGIQGFAAEVMIDTYWSPQMVLDL